MNIYKLQNIAAFIMLLFLTIFSSYQSLAEPDNDPEEDDITIAMTAAFVSEEGLDIYADIAKYLEKRLHEDTHFLTNLSYSTVNAMIEDGAVDLAFVCGYPYVLLHDGAEHPPVKLIAAPVMKSPLYEGKPIYYSYIIVAKDSPIETFEELKGKRWVFNDKTSNSGYNMPRAKLIELGETNGFFSEVIHSGSHERSIKWVAEGRADASAVDSLVLDYALATGEDYAKGVKIIDKLGPAGIPPVVVSSKTSDENVQKLKDILLHMHEDPEGQKLLEKAFLDKFVAVDDALFDGVRHMHQIAVDTNFMEVR